MDGKRYGNQKLGSEMGSENGIRMGSENGIRNGIRKCDQKMGLGWNRMPFIAKNNLKKNDLN